MSDEVERDATEGLRDDWWHVLLGFPILAPIGALLGGAIGALLIFPLWLLYPLSVYYDAQYVRAANDDWEPGTRFALVAGGAAFLTLGLLSVVVSPYYLYKRHHAVGTP